MNNICVFCSSSDVVDESYFFIAKNLAEKIAEKKFNLIYGGSNVGLMNAIAVNAKQNGAKVIGVIPEKILEKGLGSDIIDELIVTPDMHSRKAKLEEMADAFIAMPGGFGTLEELAEVITLRQLEYHYKPIVILNHNNFYDKLIEFFEVLYAEKFAKKEYRKVYFVTDDIEKALDYIINYKPLQNITKWFQTNF